MQSQQYMQGHDCTQSLRTSLHNGDFCLANCIQHNFLGVFVPLSDLHNSFSESVAKTMQTVQANKRYQQVLFTVSQWFSKFYWKMRT